MRLGVTLACLAVGVAGCGGTPKVSNGLVPHTSTPAGGAPRSTTTSSGPASTPTAPGPTEQLQGSLRLSSPAFANGARIPARYTCDGPDVPPPLRWRGIPRGTRELLLVMRDPTAPTPNFVHWAVAGIPPTASGVPATGIQARNSFGSLGYRGPCPPRGDPPHHYVIALSALAAASGLARGFDAGLPVHSRALAIATLNATYRR